jgi:hypothetical protein
MPEREQLIAQWRRNLAETTGCTKEVLDELESHLRDDVQQFMQAGHSEEQALALAASRLGHPRVLAAEFAKITGPASWLPARLATFAAVAVAALLVGYLLGRHQDGRFELLLAVHVGAITIGYTYSLLAGTLVICYVAARAFRDLNEGQMLVLERAVVVLTATASVLTFAGILLGCFWAKDHLGRYWDWDPKETWAAVVLIWGAVLLLLLATRSGQHRVLLLAILGNAVIGFAWFAGAPPLRNAVIVFALTQLILFALGYVPAGLLRRHRV